MVEKIIVKPTEVRGLGNIMNVKTDEDYELVDCTITEATDTVNGASVNVIVMEPTFWEPTTLTVTPSSATLVLNDSVTISATLKDSSNTPISGVDLTFKKSPTSSYTTRTNSEGVATYTFTGSSVGSYTISVIFDGDLTYASSSVVPPSGPLQPWRGPHRLRTRLWKRPCPGSCPVLSSLHPLQ